MNKTNKAISFLKDNELVYYLRKDKKGGDRYFMSRLATEYLLGRRADSTFRSKKGLRTYSGLEGEGLTFSTENLDKKLKEIFSDLDNS